jgi:hypothetical protein
MVVALTVLLLDLVRGGAAAAPAQGRLALLLGAGTLAGILAAAGVTWMLLAPIVSYYRRGGLSIVASFATVVLMLLTIPVHQLAGRAGLGAAAAMCAVAALGFAVSARRAAILP